MTSAEQMLAGSPEITSREFARIRDLVYERIGVDLRAGKERLVSSRLAKHIRAGGFPSFDAYFKHVIADHSGSALTAFLDALTTNHTSFLREPQHLRFLVDTVLPKLSVRGEIRVWSAACSTGEEPYSILFSLLEAISAVRNPPRVTVMGSDISTRVLDRAAQGLFAVERVNALPEPWRRKYFLRGQGQYSGWFQVKQQYRRMVGFERLNLIEPLPSRSAFPVIFCRNVMIYFNRTTQTGVVRRLTDCLEPGGYLFVGHAESLTGIDHSLLYVKPAVYQKPDKLGGRH